MPRGGKREGAGRKSGAAYPGKRGERSKSYQRILAWANQLWDIGQKEKAVRLYEKLLNFDEPRLNAVAAQVTTQVTYVARLPQQVLDITEWQNQTKPLLDKK
jgi:hypothetical protein